MAKIWQFLQGHPKPSFTEKVQGPSKTQQHSGANGIIPELVCTYRAKTGEDLGAKKRLQKFPNDQVMAILARSPKTRIFLKSAKGGPKELFQKSPKKMTSLKGPKSTLA